MYVILSFFPSLYGCLWQEFHLKGEIDANGSTTEEVESATVEEIETK